MSLTEEQRKRLKSAHDAVTGVLKELSIDNYEITAIKSAEWYLKRTIECPAEE